MVPQPIGTKKTPVTSTAKKTAVKAQTRNTPVKAPAVQAPKKPINTAMQKKPATTGPKKPVTNTLPKKPTTAIGQKKPLPAPTKNVPRQPQQQGWLNKGLSAASSGIGSAVSAATSGIGNAAGAVVTAAGSGVAGAGRGAGARYLGTSPIQRAKSTDIIQHRKHFAHMGRYGSRVRQLAQRHHWCSRQPLNDTQEPSRSEQQWRGGYGVHGEQAQRAWYLGKLEQEYISQQPTGSVRASVRVSDMVGFAATPTSCSKFVTYTRRSMEMLAFHEYIHGAS